MIDFNQLINTTIANVIELAVRDQLTPYILQLQNLDDLVTQRQVLLNQLEQRVEDHAKVIGYLNAEIVNLKAPQPVEVSGERMDHYIGEWFTNNQGGIIESIADNGTFSYAVDCAVADYISRNDADVFDSIEDRVDRRIESALEDFEFDMDDLADKVTHNIDFDEKISDFLRNSVTVSIDII